jgi:hypothetical protein
VKNGHKTNQAVLERQEEVARPDVAGRTEEADQSQREVSVVVEDPPHLAQRRRMVLLMTEKEMNTTKETYPDLVVRKATKLDSITDVQLPGCDAPAGGRLLQEDGNTTATDSGH